ncbi:hypothetical protein CcaverHIS002_0303880 [Cutaneotrichosporon cavernicola]|uniref:Metallo-beta-lactamase domain-containing protein n=1 Tax=Cutaneotrichosporon cavernicola TaxID=279322 RepID=A0AA48IF96_9TREE|nr:uncharacterized protein CcaverHIS019_0303860 [Cutaneotrichosporon cavernicola]BEI82520.1 hypothetical protein CcaverHIS002_0303880 [Cutaneotrichosporon cavernicola]BEI90316.1 hypothetical protein CcaverHIS019_0303860 [Cutaneotrichosporon cavernicola]BEI98092.1 hypothetical protein CcaverHIS631_0303910 [Cutaneotrichosporon cavernicola]BEJ05869.1 hypothetical protein CcaverHIS641_0303910 [Cutaneotrichosporon cavernicola]
MASNTNGCPVDNAPADDETLRVHFLGTGTSTALPVGPCLAEVDKPSRDVGLFLDDYNAAPEDKRTPHQWGGYDPSAQWPGSVPCGSCRGAVDPRVKDGWKNRRGNPAVVLRKKRGGEWRNVVVDVGKTFREQSCKLFPRWGIKRIDAVIITHGHADAYNGLDDLREWCGRQGGHIPIYCSALTFETISASFPYLVDKTKASGGGDLPSLHFHILKDDTTPFEVEGITVAPLPVHHGSYFSAAPPAEPSKPGTPINDVGHHGPKPTASKEPFICLGFVFDSRLVYLSDLNSVPDKTWDLINAAVPNKADSVLIMDTLWPWRPHPSHVSFPQAMDITLGIKPKATYLLGMTHPTTHYIWEEVGLSIRDQQRRDPGHQDTALADMLIKRIWESEDMARIAADLKTWGGRVEPAWDGLAIEMGPGRLEQLPIGKDGSAGGWGVDLTASL